MLLDTSFITQWFTLYSFPTAFVGAFFFGESVILTLTFLTVHLHHSFALFALALLLGTVTSDSVWFFVGIKGSTFLARKHLFEKQRAVATDLLQHVTGSRPFLVLLFIKFLYGSRIAMIFYVASQHVPFYTFLLFNVIGTVIWLSILLSLGFFAAHGIRSALPLLGTIETAFVVFILSIIIFRLLSLWLIRYLKKK